MLSYSYMPDYFSISDILATEERISCKIETTLPGLGFLDTSGDYKDLKAGTAMELPVWIAHPLNNMQVPIVSVDIPKIYKEGYGEILQADASAVMLSKWNPYFYELGMHLRKLNHRDCEKITDNLLQAFKNRFRLVMDWSQNPIDDASIFLYLPCLEKHLFTTGTKSKEQLIKWLNKGTGTIATSEVAANLKKRKRIDNEFL